MSTEGYTNDHEWARNDDGIATVGITSYAQEQLGEVVFVELPEVGTTVNSGDETAVVESVKAAGEVKSPVSGEVVAVNEALVDNPALVNEDPTGEGWFYQVRMSDPEQMQALMSNDAYQELVDSLA